MKRTGGFLMLIGAGIIAAGAISCAATSIKTKPVNEAPTPVGWPEPTGVDVIEIKQYPAARLAVVQSERPGGSNSMFRELFNHIKSNDIPMTAPVEMTYVAEPAGEGKAAMSKEWMGFYYKDQSVGSVGAQDNVEVIDAKPVTVVSIGLKGGYSDSNYQKPYSKLLQWLDENADTYSPAGRPRVLAYNSPFVPWWMKYSGLQIPIRKTEASDR